MARYSETLPQIAPQVTLPQVLISLAAGVGLTALSLLFAYHCCNNGDARGLPLAVVVPVCEASPLWVHLHRAFVLDLLHLAGNVAIWSGMVLGAWHWINKRRWG